MRTLAHPSTAASSARGLIADLLERASGTILPTYYCLRSTAIARSPNMRSWIATPPNTRSSYL